MANETELKLELSPEAAIALVGASILPHDSSLIAHRSRYFDTADQFLAKSGFSLRIRTTGDQRIQTVKGGGSSTAGLFVRSEWECAVTTDVPVIDDTTPMKMLLGPRVSEIAPVFEVRVERRMWSFQHGSSVVEMVLDQGNVATGDRQTPICEIELELKRGNPIDLFDFARKIDAVVPVRLGVMSKSNRGTRLRAPVVTSFKAEPMFLGDHMTVAEAFQKIAGACIRQFRMNETAMDNKNAEALYRARVGLRRLRSAMSIFKPILKDDKLAWMQGEIRWLASALGEARDLDVLIPRFADSPLLPSLNAAREDAYVRAETALASPRARALMIDLSEWNACGTWLTQTSTAATRQLPLNEFACARLNRLRKKVKRIDHPLADLDDAARHQLRKDVKQLRYGVAFFESLFDGKNAKRRHEHFASSAKTLQNKLGALSDASTGTAILRSLRLGDAEIASAFALTGQEVLIEAAGGAYQNLLDTKVFWR